MTRDVLFNALKGWTGKASATVIYDSTVDEFTDQGLYNKVEGKANIALVGFTADGDVFGGFHNVAVTKQEEPVYDPDMFIFSFESHGRCETPRRFVVMEEEAYVEFFRDDPCGWFVNVGGGYGWFNLGNERSYTFCHNLSCDYVGIADTTLTGKTFPERFTCTRIVAIYLQ